jgi:hypothetical protein
MSQLLDIAVLIITEGKAVRSLSFTYLYGVAHHSTPATANIQNSLAGGDFREVTQSTDFSLLGLFQCHGLIPYPAAVSAKRRV